MLFYNFTSSDPGANNIDINNIIPLQFYNSDNKKYLVCGVCNVTPVSTNNFLNNIVNSIFKPFSSNKFNITYTKELASNNPNNVLYYDNIRSCIYFNDVVSNTSYYMCTSKNNNNNPTSIYWSTNLENSEKIVIHNSSVNNETVMK
jgi:hypothetical protein